MFSNNFAQLPCWDIDQYDNGNIGIASAIKTTLGGCLCDATEFDEIDGCESTSTVDYKSRLTRDILAEFKIHLEYMMTGDNSMAFILKCSFFWGPMLILRLPATLAREEQKEFCGGQIAIK